LTGEGEPATEWMRYAKSRSTRSKLRAYFRSLQREGLKESGKIALIEYLQHHRATIVKHSFLSTKISIPQLDGATLESYLAPFLPNSKIQYDSVDELLIAIGKRHDRSILRSIVSLLFGVSRRTLKSAEEKWQQVNGLNNERLDEHGDFSLLEATPIEQCNNFSYTSNDAIEIQQKATLPEATAFHSVDSFFATIDSKLEYADPEHLCDECLPVHGDAIVGTRARSQMDQPSTYTSATVHRIGCPRAQRAVNHAWAERRGATSISLINSKVDSVRLRQARQLVKAKANPDSSRTKRSEDLVEVPFRLEWFDLDDDDSNACDFLAEIIIHAFDRKQLLADCSTIVSDMAEIVKTGSSTYNDDATLVFLLKVNDLSHIQAVMDRLSEVPSVMSVERRFGSELLP
jgi:(p)ppGpp synthase/HD superfamily hydrolase